MVDIIILNHIGSYKVDFGCHFCFETHFLPQNFSNDIKKTVGNWVAHKVFACGENPPKGVGWTSYPSS